MIVVFDREGGVYKSNDAAKDFFELEPLKKASQASHSRNLLT